MTFSQTNFENEWWRSMQLLQKKEKHQQYIFNTYFMKYEGSKYEGSLNIYRTILHYEGCVCVSHVISSLQ